MIADLLSWFDEQRRDLPWRRGTHAYSTWVSEIMLQQTRVEAVIPYFERWMARFPDVAALAAAPEEEVMRYWAGLGYYRRARFLHRAAVQVVSERGGDLPETSEAWRELPGVGEYTSAAIASIAFGEAVPVVDGNVKRVAARVLALELAADDRKLHKAAAEWGAELMTELAEMPKGKGGASRRLSGLSNSKGGACHRPGDLNEALMELGATVCTPRAPRCVDCPVRSSCRVMQVCVSADLSGDASNGIAAGTAGKAEANSKSPEDYPRPAARTKWKKLDLVFGWAQSDRGCLLIQRQEGWNPGLWEPPSIQIPNATPDSSSGDSQPAEVGLRQEVGSLNEVGASGLQEIWSHKYPDCGELGEEICQVRHTITHHKITARVFQLPDQNSTPQGALGPARHTPPDSVALTGLARKILDKCWEKR